MNPSPLDGSYTNTAQCEGEYVEGVFFLAGAGGSKKVDRTCTVPADMPIFFPVSNVVCSEAFGAVAKIHPIRSRTIQRAPSRYYRHNRSP